MMGYRPITRREAEWIIEANNPPNGDNEASIHVHGDGIKVLVKGRRGEIFSLIERQDDVENLEDGGWRWMYSDIPPPQILPIPEFDLDDMELAEIIMEELK
jgi:hypothetical protein